MPSIVAGLDFGTSNSAIGFATASDVRLHRFEHGAQATPTALFFDEDDNALVCGHEAETRFLGGHDGRYLRALKSILGTSLADESTRMGKRLWSFRTLLTRFITHMKDEAERAAGVGITLLVAGRPVRFVDEDDGRDQTAEALLHKVLQDAGFEEVQFVYEPVAALTDCVSALEDPKIVLVADIGGGTSDFTIARASGSDGARKFEVLASHGVHIGGTDLDKRLSLKAVMPSFGLGSQMRALTSDVILPVPPGLYSDLATWQTIPFCYTHAMRREVRDVMRLALEPERLGLLLEILEQQLGYRLTTEVERAKIALSDIETATVSLNELEAFGGIAIRQSALLEIFARSLDRVAETVAETLRMADVDGGAVDHLVMTGGSTLLPDMRRALSACVSNARIVRSDPLPQSPTA